MTFQHYFQFCSGAGPLWGTWENEEEENGSHMTAVFWAGKEATLSKVRCPLQTPACEGCPTAVTSKGRRKLFQGRKRESGCRPPSDATRCGDSKERGSLRCWAVGRAAPGFHGREGPGMWSLTWPGRATDDWGGRLTTHACARARTRTGAITGRGTRSRHVGRTWAASGQGDQKEDGHQLRDRRLGESCAVLQTRI